MRDIGISVDVLNLNHFILKQSRQLALDDAFDFDQRWQQELQKKIQAFQPDLMGVTCMFTMTHDSFKAVCEHIAPHNIPLIAGGVHVSNDVERILIDIPQINIAITGEADIAFPNLLRFINQQTDIPLGQLIFNNRERGLIYNDQLLQPDSDTLDTLPALDLGNISELSDEGVIGAFYCFKPKGTKIATVLSNRGCRASCTFCSVRNFNGVGVRQRSVESVLDEIKILYHDYGVRHLMWLDDDLLKNHKRSIALFNAISNSDMKDLTWDATNGLIAYSCTDEIVSAMADSGCIAINIGMESGNREILRSVRKPGTPDNFLKAAEVLRRYEKIHSSVFLMIGFPNETLSMIMDTVNVAIEMDLDWYRISQLQPLPNTPIYDSMVEQGLIQDVGSKIRFNGGAYGKQTQIEQGKVLAAANFAQAFSNIPMDAIPNAEQLTDIWFFMNYTLNFHRIFHESRPEKIQQLEAHLTTLADIISPENGFALYFQAVLEYRTKGNIPPAMIDRLERRLQTSPYWSDRFEAFDLSINDLKHCDFQGKEAPCEMARASHG